MHVLPFLLVAPTLVVLGVLYWLFPRRLARPRGREIFDLVALLLAVLVAVGLIVAGLASPSPAHVDALGHHSGAIWPQVVAVLYAYGGYSVVLIVAAVLRQLVWQRRVTPLQPTSNRRTMTGHDAEG